MDSLRAYLLRALPAELRDPSRLTDQARPVRALLLDESVDDRARVRAILDLLLRDARLERDTLVWLKTVLRGHYGIEYAAADLSEDEQLRFWEALAGHFHGNADTMLGLIHADALLLAGELPRALRAFNDCFEADPSTVSDVGGEVGDLMAEEGGEHYFRYRLALLRQAMKNGDDDLVMEIEAELRAERAGDTEALAAVDRARARPSD